MKNNGNILIADDNASFVTILSMVLNRKGYNVAAARNGREAVNMVKEKTYDMILMDVLMPGMDGLETFREIRKLNAKAKVAMMTAYSVEDKLNEAMNEGAMRIFYKPLEMNQLVDFLDKNIGNGSPPAKKKQSGASGRK